MPTVRLAFLDLLNSPVDYLVAVVLLCLTCSVLFVAFAIGAYKWTTRERYPAAPRPRSPREPEIDLAKERYEFESRRDAWHEARILKRAS